MLPYLFLSSKQISNTYVLMILKTLVPTFAAGFVLFCGFFDWLFIKYKLL